MPADLTSMDAALKETWTESRLAEQLYQKNPLLDKVKKFRNTQVGQQAVTPIHTGRNWGVTFTTSAGGTLNAAGQQALAQATWQYTHQHAQVKVQGSAIDGTRGDALSVAEVINLEVDGALDDLNRQLTRQLFSDGDGLIAQCGVTTAANVVVLNAISGFNALERGWIGGSSATQGALVDIGTTVDSDVVAGSRVITSYAESSTAPTITISGAVVTTTASHYVSLTTGRSTTDGTSREMNGLGNIVSTSATIGGLTTAANPLWASPSVDTTSQALTLPLMYAQDRKVFQKTGKETTYKLTSPKQLEAAYKLAQAQVRFGSDAVSFGNIEATNIGGMDIYRQPDCKNEDMWFLTVEDLLIVSAGDPFWQDKITGGSRLEWIQNEDAYGGKITVRMNMGARRRNSHAALRGLT